MEEKHTPGPWYIHDEVEKNKNGPGYIGTYDIKSNMPGEKSGIWIGNTKPYGTNGFTDNVTALANAKLMAASPDMITELKENHEFLLRIYNSINTYGNAVNLDQIQTDMRDRMAKQLSIIEKATT